MTNRYEEMVVSLGMQITERSQAWNGIDTFEAVMETPIGELSIYCGSNGVARVDKPNGTHKWYYEKSPAQIRAALKKSIEWAEWISR